MGSRGGRAERILSGLHSRHGARPRARSRDPEDHDLEPKSRVRSRMLNQLRPPGTPVIVFYAVCLDNGGTRLL